MKTTATTFVCRAEDFVADPGMTAEMIEIHLIVVTNFFLIVPVRVSSEHDQIVSYYVARVKSSLARNISVRQMCSRIMNLRPNFPVELKNKHPVRKFAESSDARYDTTVDQQ